MDREIWRAIVRGVTRVGHDLASKPPHSRIICIITKEIYSKGMSL